MSSRDLVLALLDPWFSKEYGDKSPWGRPVLPPECLNAIMLGSINGQRAKWPKYPESDDWLVKEVGGRTPVGLFGGCEVCRSPAS